MNKILQTIFLGKAYLMFTCNSILKILKYRHLSLFVGVSKKLEQAAKKKVCQPIRPWIKSTVNHMYWIAATCGTDAELKKAKWLSIVNHVSDKHDRHHELFPKCEPGPIVESKKWITSGTYMLFV